VIAIRVLAGAGVGLALLCGSIAAANQQPPADAAGGKKPGITRIGVATSGTSVDSIRTELMALLQGDGSLIEVVPLTNRIEAFRLAEAKKQECDFILDATFEAKAKAEGGGVLSRLTKVVGTVNKESGNFKNTKERQDDVDRKTGSMDNIAKELAPTPKDKVRVAYRLLPLGAAKPVLADDKEIVAGDLPAYLETLLNDVVTQVLK
jgi:hypothetical protein